MSLIIDNKLINTPLLTIIKQIKSELFNGKLKDIKDKHSYILITCPYHNNGKESHPSCGVYCGDDPKIEFAKLHCFTCGEVHNICEWIGQCFDEDENFGKEWLLERFGSGIAYEENKKEELKPIYINNKPKKIIDESILDNFQSYHPYMTQRKLTPEVIEKFKIKYDPKDKSIVFPVWDEFNKLVMLTKRNIEKKMFYIEEDIKKPIYLLNYILNNNIKKVYVCESQINTLTLQGWGYNAIGLIGTGNPYQYNILKKSGINHYILCLDRDEAGVKGIKRFINNLSKYAFIDVIKLPPNKDVNDLTKEEFESLTPIDSYEYLIRN